MSGAGTDTFIEAVEAAADDMHASPRATFSADFASLNVFARICTDRVNRMLTSLYGMFPENAELGFFVTLLQEHILGDTEREVSLVQEWYDQMTGGPVDLMQAVRDRDAAVLLAAEVDLLTRIGARGMYDDPDVLPEDREEMMKHLELINEAATAFVFMPTEFQTLLTSTLMKLDSTQPLELQSIFSAVAETVRGSLGVDDADGFTSVDVSERLLGLASQMLNMISAVGLDPLLRMCNPAQLVAATGCSDVGELADQLKSEARKCFASSDLPDGAIDAAFELPFMMGK